MLLHWDFSDLLTWLAILAIGIAILIAWLQVRQANKMKDILDHIKERESRRKIYYLLRIQGNTLRIKHNLQALLMFVERYSQDRQESSWESIKIQSEQGKHVTQNMIDVSEADFEYISDLIVDRVLIDKYKPLVGEAISVFWRAEGYHGAFGLLFQIREAISAQTTIIDDMLNRIKSEMPTEEEKPKFWRARGSPDQPSL